MTKHPVVIIGAGIGGVSTGLLLVNKNINVKIFEKHLEEVKIRAKT